MTYLFFSTLFLCIFFSDITGWKRYQILTTAGAAISLLTFILVGCTRQSGGYAKFVMVSILTPISGRISIYLYLFILLLFVFFRCLAFARQNTPEYLFVGKLILIRKNLFFYITYSHQPTYITINEMDNSNNEGIIFTIFHIGGSNEGNNRFSSSIKNISL